jgi:hypothetical protein
MGVAAELNGPGHRPESPDRRVDRFFPMTA